ncbi:MAG: DUF3800 domain-containing protein [Candidatus Bathyarchaeota archaeon]|nr:DUF3800 domain-containing protein [Candidatus Bathyarchaeum tardum]
MYVYVDESGDLGFSDKSTKFFIIAYLACTPAINIRIRMRRLLKNFHQKKRYHRGQNELKFCKMNNYCRKTVLETIVQTNANIGAIVVEKKHVSPDLRDKLPILYNYLMVHNIISALLPSLETGQKMNMIFDKSLPKTRIQDFNDYVKEKASYLSYVRGNSLHSDSIVSDHVDSKVEPCLQAVDSIAGAYFQKYEHENSIYVDIIKDVTSFNYLWRK